MSVTGDQLTRNIQQLGITDISDTVAARIEVIDNQLGIVPTIDNDNSEEVCQSVMAPNDEYVIERLQLIDTITDIAPVTEDHDPNGQLNKQGGYIGCIYFRDSQVDESEIYVESEDVIEIGTAGGGAIEIFANVDDAEKRNAYLATYDGTIISSGSHYVYGTCVIRTSDHLSATQQNELTETIKQVLSAENIDDLVVSDTPTTEEDLSSDSEKETEVAEIETLETESDVDADNTEEVIQLEVKRYITTENVNIRTTPSTDGEVITGLGANQELDIIDIEDGWAHTTYNNQDAYVKSDYLQVLENKGIEDEGVTSSFAEEELLQFESNGDFFGKETDNYAIVMSNVKEGNIALLTASLEAHMEKDKDSTATIENILAVLEKYGHFENLVSETDSFTGKTVYRYSGYSGIDSEHYVYPYVTSDSSDCNLTLGFVADDWIFAEEMALKTDEDQLYEGIWFRGKSYDYDRDVLDGGKVKESKTERLFDSDTYYLRTLKERGLDVRLRCSEDVQNPDFPYIEYTLNEDDIEALYEVGNFSMALGKIGDLKFLPGKFTLDEG